MLLWPGEISGKLVPLGPHPWVGDRSSRANVPTRRLRGSFFEGTSNQNSCEGDHSSRNFMYASKGTTRHESSVCPRMTTFSGMITLTKMFMAYICVRQRRQSMALSVKNLTHALACAGTSPATHGTRPHPRDARVPPRQCRGAPEARSRAIALPRPPSHFYAPAPSCSAEELPATGDLLGSLRTQREARSAQRAPDAFTRHAYLKPSARNQMMTFLRLMSGNSSVVLLSTSCSLPSR